MAEYIDKEQLDRKFIIEMLAPSTTTIFDAKDIIDELQPADVIERSEYEALQKENHELAIKYDNAMNKVINSEAALKRLHSKIDEAIEEIEEESYLSYDNNPRRILDEECVLEILKRM